MRLDEAAAHLCVKSFPASRPGRRQGSVWSTAIQVDGVGGPATGDLSFPYLCLGLFPYRFLTTGRINGPFKRAQGPSNKVCCGLKPSHPEPRSLRPQPINPNIIRNGGIHSRILLCSPSRLSLHSWRLCLLPGTVDAAPVSDDEVRLLRGFNHHEGWGLDP